MKRSSTSWTKILYLIILGICGVIPVGLVNQGKLTVLPHNRKAREIDIREEKNISKTIILKFIPLDKRSFFQEGPPFLFFSPTDELWVKGKASEERGGLTPLIVFKQNGKQTLLWLNTAPSALWFNFSPDGNYLAYPGNHDSPGIWVMNLKEKRARLVAPEVLDGKKISSQGVIWSPDSKRFLLSRVDEELQNRIGKAGIPFAKGYERLGEKKMNRLFELWDLYTKQNGQLPRDELEELKSLTNEFYISVGKEQIKDFWQATALYLQGQEVRVVDIGRGVEIKVFQPGWPKGWTSDGKWVYVEELPARNILKINLESSEEKKYVSPAECPTVYRIPSEADKWIINYKSRNAGLWLKEVKSDKEIMVDSRMVELVEWNWKGDKIAYVVEGKRFYEIWLFDLHTMKKQKICP